MHHTDTPQGLPHRADELENAPLLKALRHKQTPEIPAAYFETLNSRLADRMLDADVLAEAPNLMALGRGLKPEAPTGYFENLPSAILQQVTESRVLSLWKRPAVWAVAAGIIVLLSLAPLLNTNNINNAVQASDELIASLNDQELLAMADYADTDAEDIAAIFELEDVSINDLEEISSDDAEALLESLDLSDLDITDLLNETD